MDKKKLVNLVSTGMLALTVGCSSISSCYASGNEKNPPWLNEHGKKCLKGVEKELDGFKKVMYELNEYPENPYLPLLVVSTVEKKLEKNGCYKGSIGFYKKNNEKGMTEGVYKINFMINLKYEPSEE